MAAEFGKLSEKEKVELAEKVFTPGNLVWGGHINNFSCWTDITTQGIKAPKDHKQIIKPQSPKSISFELIRKNTALKERSTSLMHYGPREDRSDQTNGIYIPRFPSLNIAVVISREKILEAFREKLFAVGSNFIDKEQRNYLKLFFDFDNAKNEVFEIPIMGEADREQFEPRSDEVRVYPGDKDEDKKGVTPDMWEGIIIISTELPILKKFHEQSHLEGVPVFSPYCRLLALKL